MQRGWHDIDKGQIERKSAPRGGLRWRFPSLCGIHIPPENGKVTSSSGVYEIGGSPEVSIGHLPK